MSWPYLYFCVGVVFGAVVEVVGIRNDVPMPVEGFWRLMLFRAFVVVLWPVFLAVFLVAYVVEVVRQGRM